MYDALSITDSLSLGRKIVNVIESSSYRENDLKILRLHSLQQRCMINFNIQILLYCKETYSYLG